MEVVAGAPAAEKIIATVNLSGRAASYCVYALNRVTTARHRSRLLGCPSSYLRNVLRMTIDEPGGPFYRRHVDIDYLYDAEGGSVALGRCISPDIVDGVFIRHVWKVPVDDRSAAFIAETAVPNPRDLGSGLPFATSVVGATNR